MSDKFESHINRSQGVIQAKEVRIDQINFQLPSPDSVSTPQQVPPNAPLNVPPQTQNMFWMPYAHIWYGPFFGFFLGWGFVGVQSFYVWHPNRGALAYPDPFGQMPLMIWMRLAASPFNVLIDFYRRVFGLYNP